MGIYSLVFFSVVLCWLFCLVKVSNVDALGEGKKLEPYILVSPRRRKEAIPHLTKRSLPDFRLSSYANTLNTFHTRSKHLYYSTFSTDFESSAHCDVPEDRRGIYVWSIVADECSQRSRARELLVTSLHHRKSITLHYRCAY